MSMDPEPRVSNSVGSPVGKNCAPEARLMQLSLLLGVILMCVKFWAYYRTGSTAIFSDAMENVVNVLAAGFALYAVTLASRPADWDHPYGHGKIEFMSAGFEGGMILIAGLLVIARALQSIVLHQSPRQIGLGVEVSVVSLLVYGIAGLFLRQRGKQVESIAVEAEGVHLLGDALTSLVVVGGLLVVHLTGQASMDAVAGLVVSFYLMWQAWGLVRRSAAGLMDEQDAADSELLGRILDAHVSTASRPGRKPEICGYAHVRHRHSGKHHFVDFHLRVPAWWDVQRGHEVASAIESEIETGLAHSSATAHIEPCASVTCPCCKANASATKDQS
jgi:cation diffusion facilitator family transporter